MVRAKEIKFGPEVNPLYRREIKGIFTWRILLLNNNEIPLYLLEWPKCRTLAKPNAKKNVVQQEFSFFMGRNAEWFISATLEGSLVSNKTKHTLYTIQQSCPLKELKTYIHVKTCTWMFIAYLSVIVKTERQPGCPSLGEWINKRW